MNWVDIIIIIISVIFALIALKQGIIQIALFIIGLFVGVVLAGNFHESLGRAWGEASWLSVLAFIIIIIVVLISFSVIGFIVKRFLSFALIGWVDKLLGAVFGFLVGLILSAAIFSAVAKVDLATHAISQSPIAELLIDRFPLLLGLLPSSFDFLKNFFI
jgi:membrane protein required for colicin V production